jgi:putative ABC transport system permease protein
MWTDLHFAARLLARRPAFAATAILTFAVGLGTTAAIFSLVDHVLLRPLPYPGAERLVVLWEKSPTVPVPVVSVAPPNLYEWQRRTQSFEAMGGFEWRNVALGGTTEPEQIRAARVTDGFLRAIGVQPQRGRLFTPEEDRAGAPSVVLISDKLWRRRFQQDPNIVGRTVLLDGTTTEVVGVMPPGFICPPPVVTRGSPPVDDTELWLPHGTNLEAGQRGAHYLSVVARLKPGITIDMAASDLNSVQEQIEREHPEYRNWRGVAMWLTDVVTASTRRSISLVVAAVLFVAILACANVAGILVARGAERRREFSIRAALGASNARIGSQVVIETIVLALCGGLAGLAIAATLVRGVALFGPRAVTSLSTTRVDLRTVGFTLGASLVAAAIAGLLPALAVTRERIMTALADRSGSAGATQIQRVLVGGQIALAVALVVTATLLVDSFARLRTVETGFQQNDVITAKLRLQAASYRDAASRIRFVDEVIGTLAQFSGVEAIGLINTLPISDTRQGTEFSRMDGPPADPNAALTANVAWITEGYFEAMSIPVLDGRTFTSQDRRGTAPVVVINERLARQVFGTDRAVGRMVRSGSSIRLTFEVIGVVGNERHAGVAVDAPASFFLPYRQFPSSSDLALVIRDNGSSSRESVLTSFLSPIIDRISDSMRRGDLVRGVRETVRRIDPNLPIFQVRTMDEILDASVATPRSMAWLVSAFAGIAILLAAVGVYGVVNRIVTNRLREFGVRLAIGASRTQVIGSVVRYVVTPSVVGILLGGLLAMIIAQSVSTLFFGVTPFSPRPYVLAALVMTLVSMCACLVPALRAMRIDPASLLRSE